MLAAQFALGLQPVVEQTFAGRDNLKVLQGDVLIALGLVVAVQLLESAVQDVGKLLYALRGLRELDEPLVATLGVLVHEDRRSGILQHLGACQLAGILQSLLGIVDDEFLAKGVDEALGATRDDELIGVGGCELHRVAQHIAPQATRGGDEHGVVLASLDTPQGHDIVGAHLLELVEDVVVEHQQH